MSASEIGGVFDLRQLPIGCLEPDREFNPRTEFAAEPLEELVASLQDVGLQTPLRVRPLANGQFAVLAGERRLRALQAAGATEVSCLVVDGVTDPADILCHQLIDDNFFTELNPMDRAKAFSRLMELKNWSRTQLADSLKIRPYRVFDSLALLELSEEVQELVRTRKIGTGVARLLAKLPKHSDQETLAARAVAEDLSEKAMDSAVKRLSTVRKTVRRKSTKKTYHPGRQAKVVLHAPQGFDAQTALSLMSRASTEALRDLLAERGLDAEMVLTVSELAELLSAVASDSYVEAAVGPTLKSIGLTLLSELFELTKADDSNTVAGAKSVINSLSTSLKLKVHSFRKK